MPSADFCTAIREPHDPLSPFRDTMQISRGKPDHLQRTTAGFTPRALGGYGLRDLWLARPTRHASYPVLVHRLAPLLHASFRPHLAMTPLRFARPSPPPGWSGDFHPQVIEHARHTRMTAGRLRAPPPCSDLAIAAAVSRPAYPRRACRSASRTPPSRCR